MPRLHRPSRRTFLGTTAAAAAAGWMSPQSEAGPATPGETVRLALVGCGARGAGRLMPVFSALPNARIVAVCDVHSKRLAAARERAGGAAVAAHRDFRRLLDDRGVDAVLVATQQHWHALITVAACQAGKDVYLEKPLGNRIGEGPPVIRAAKRYDRIVQIGTQQRSQEHYARAVELIRSGALGEISEVRVWDHTYMAPGRGFPANCDPPPELDWDLYVGPSAMRPYNPNVYYKYGYDWFRVSGAGHQVAWGVHHFDIVSWAMGAGAPDAATALGGHLAYQDNCEWPNTLEGTLQFSAGPVARHGFLLQYSMRSGCRRVRRAHAKCFYGTKASLLLDRSGYSILPEATGGASVATSGHLTGEETFVPAADDSARHMAVFLDNVRSRSQPEANAVTGHRASTYGHLLNVSWDVGRTVRWDGERDQVIGDPEAQALVTPSYRPPWKLEA